MSPLYVLYDLRVAYSHLASAEKQRDKFQSVVNRLGIDASVSLTALYDHLIEVLIATFERLAKLVDVVDTDCVDAGLEIE